jgi:DNA primase
MAIPQHTIDQILDRTDIVDLIGQRVKLKKTGRTYSGCCPFHQEKSHHSMFIVINSTITALVVRQMAMQFVF